MSAIADDDWPGYNRTLAGDRFSPLKEVDRSNVARLKAICAYTLPEVTSLQTGPIVLSGTMFFTTDTISYAIDASTCAEKWKQVRHSPTPSALAVNRGFAYLDGRLFRGTSDAHVLAMDPGDGHVPWDHEIDAKAPGMTIPMAPIAANGLVYAGNAGGDQVGVTGGSEWNGAAYSPSSNTIFVGAVDWCANVKLEAANTPVPAAGQPWLAAGNPFPEIADPPARAKGWLTAFDAENGAVRWKYAAPSPILAGVTPTAGGLVFAADMRGTLYALDSESGRVLWQTNTGQSTGGGVIAYTAGGRELLGVASGMKSSTWPGGANQSRIRVYGLR